MELTAEGKTLAEVKIQRCTFILLFEIAIMSFNQILRNALGTTNLQNRKINHLMYADNIKLFTKNDCPVSRFGL